MANPYARVVSAKYVRDYKLRLHFTDRPGKVVDFSRWLHGEVFQPLANKREFKRFFIAGGTSAGQTMRTSPRKRSVRLKTPRATRRSTAPLERRVQSPSPERGWAGVRE